MHRVNLDALIAREDFELVTQGENDKRPVLRLTDLELFSINFSLLRKPLFQRETASWPPEKIAEFIKSFLDGELIPNIIMWWSKQSGRIWVIDGAHRLSALIAWVNDDYGDGQHLSQPFSGHRIPPEQKKLADQTRSLIEKIGSYQKLKNVERNPAAAESDEMRVRANGFTTLPIEAQWVIGDASKAESSFFKINGNPTTIEPIELDIIQARRKPNSIATRAIMRRGTGYRYWNFDAERVKTIESLAREVHDLLFTPILETPVRTLDLPIAGEGYSAEAFKLVFDIINVFNEFTPAMWKVKDDQKKPSKKNVKPRKNTKPRLADDEDGEATIEVLRRTKKLIELISGDNPRGGSLGVDPAVYFWGATGRFHPQAVLGLLKFVKELREQNKFERFTDVRAEFEDFLMRHRSFLNQIVKSKGGGQRSLETLADMYRILFRQLTLGGVKPDDAAIIAEMRKNQRLKDLEDKPADELEEDGRPAGARFTKEVKSAGYLNQTKDAAPRCPICRARLHVKSMSSDHIRRIADGGRGEIKNHQTTHPFCNNGYREAKREQREKEAASETVA